MKKQLRVLMIGAHLDDNDFCGGGTALKYINAGHKVRFLSMCNGCGGHHIHTPKEIAERRYNEAQEVARLTGIEYDVWDIDDCTIMADLETRMRLVRYIREFNPDIIFTHRTNDYHADHRNAALLVQDASYLLIVPNFCPEAPAMKVMPVIMYFRDRFTEPPFVAKVAVSIDDVVDKKLDMFNCHVSQVYEWLPYTAGIIDQVPESPEERLEWLHQPRVERNGRKLTEESISVPRVHTHCEVTEAIPTVKCRRLLVARYGEAGYDVVFSEVFGVSEYGTPLTEKNIDTLFPF